MLVKDLATGELVNMEELDKVSTSPYKPHPGTLTLTLSQLDTFDTIKEEMATQQAPNHNHNPNHKQNHNFNFKPTPLGCL